jgi:acetolactate synthase I/II/III large subunit
MAESDTPSQRRQVLKGLVGAGAASLAAHSGAQVPLSNPDNPPAPAGKAPVPTASAREAERGIPPELPQLTAKMPGSDFMVDVCKTLGFDYIAACPGSTFRALQESFINYGKNKVPEWLTSLHEEVAVGAAHGYAKVAGKPMLAIVHGTVGTQHAAMAIYNAYCDRVPLIIVTGNAGAAEDRHPGVGWFHSVQDGAATVRDIVKWDDYPRSLQHFAESMVHGYALSCAQPSGPVFITADSALQERPIEQSERQTLRIPRLSPPSQPVGDTNALVEAARMLVKAEAPVIVVDRYARSQQGMDTLVQLAELLQAPVVDRFSRLNLPTTHYLYQQGRASELLSASDCILSLEPVDLFGQFNGMIDQLDRTGRSHIRSDAKLICISTRDSLVHANYQDLQRYFAVDLNIAGDAQTTLPFLIEALKREVNRNRKRSFEARSKQLREMYENSFNQALADASVGWDATPISSARMYMELWAQIKHEDWALVSDGGFSSMWPHRLWPLEKHYQFIGDSGGAGIGYQPVAALGAALAHRDAGGRVVINVCGDGEFNMAPSTMWTAAHHHIPYLTIIQNNRAYHQEVMHLQRMANRHNRDIRNAHIGTRIEDPNIDYAKVAQGYGAAGFGPITDPNDLADAFRRGIAAVKEGQPVLIDVVMQPR